MKKNYKRIILYSADNILNQTESQADIEAKEKRREIVISIHEKTMLLFYRKLDLKDRFAIYCEIKERLNKQKNSR